MSEHGSGDYPTVPEGVVIEEVTEPRVVEIRYADIRTLGELRTRTLRPSDGVEKERHYVIVDGDKVREGQSQELTHEDVWYEIVEGGSRKARGDAMRSYTEVDGVLELSGMECRSRDKGGVTRVQVFERKFDKHGRAIEDILRIDGAVDRRRTYSWNSDGSQTVLDEIAAGGSFDNGKKMRTSWSRAGNDDVWFENRIIADGADASRVSRPASLHGPGDLSGRHSANDVVPTPEFPLFVAPEDRL